MKRAVSRKVDERARRDEPVAPKRAGSRNVDERARRGESAAPSGAPSHKVDERARRDEIVPPKHAGSRKVGERVRRDELASPKRAGPGKVDALLCAIGRASTVPTVRSAVRSCLREWKRDEPREIALAALELARRGAASDRWSLPSAR